MAVDDFVMTIDSDNEAASVEPAKNKDIVEDAQLNPDFVFDLSGDPYNEFLGESNLQDFVKKGSKSVRSCKPSLVCQATYVRSRNRSLLTTLLSDGDSAS